LCWVQLSHKVKSCWKLCQGSSKCLHHHLKKYVGLSYVDSGLVGMLTAKLNKSQHLGPKLFLRPLCIVQTIYIIVLNRFLACQIWTLDWLRKTAPSPIPFQDLGHKILKLVCIILCISCYVRSQSLKVNV